jgi:hypothetical protein
MIETLIQELTKAIRENTEALKAKETPVAAPAPKKATKVEPEPTPAVEPEQAEPTPAAEPEQPADIGKPTKVSAPKRKPIDDTPSVPAVAVLPGQPPAGEHVDVDETIAQITKIVKTKMMEGDSNAVKEKWSGIRAKFGIERVTELRDEPAKLLACLAQAKAL